MAVINIITCSIIAPIQNVVEQVIQQYIVGKVY